MTCPSTGSMDISLVKCYTWNQPEELTCRCQGRKSFLRKASSPMPLQLNIPEAYAVMAYIPNINERKKRCTGDDHSEFNKPFPYKEQKTHPRNRRCKVLAVMLEFTSLI